MFRPSKQKAESAIPSLELFQDFADAVNSGILFITPDHRIAYMNKAARRTWGERAGDLCHAALRESRDTCHDCPVDRIMEGEPVVRQEMRMRAGAGWRTHENLYIAARGTGDKPQFVVLLSTDVDETRHLEREVLKEKELRGALLRSVNTIVIGVDPSLRVEFVNRACEEISGYTSEEIARGGGIHMLFPEESRDDVDSYFSAITEGIERPNPLLAPLVGRLGKERMISWTYSPLIADSGEVGGALVLGQDVTDRFSHRMQVEKRARELEFVNNILGKASTALEISELLEEVLVALMELEAYRVGAAYILEGGGATGRRIAHRGFRGNGPREVVTGSGRIFPATAAYDGEVKVVWPGEPMHPMASEVMEAQYLKGIVALPVTPGGYPVGLLLLGHDMEPAALEDSLGILKSATEALDLGAENLFLRERAEERAAEANALYRVTKNITGALGRGEVMEKTVEEGARLFKVDSCGIFLYDGGSGLLTGATGNLSDTRPASMTMSEIGAVLEASRTLKPVIVDDCERDPRYSSRLFQINRFRSCMIVPLVMESRFFGAVTLDSTEGRLFTEREAELAEGFASQVAVAIHNASLVDDLKRSEEKYRALVESADDIVFTFDTGGRITFINESANRILGYRPVEVMGRHYTDFVPQRYWGEIEEGAKALLSGSKVKAVHLELRTKDGTHVYLDFSLAPLIVGGKVVAVTGIARDFTDRVRAEEALRTSEGKYRTLVESSQDAIMILDPKGRVLFANSRSPKLTGLTPGELIGRNIYDFVHPDDKEETALKFRASWESGGTVTRYPVRGVAEGRERYFEATTAVLGEPSLSSNTMLIISDVTDRELAKRRLEESEERYRTIVETSRDVVVLANRAGELLYANPRIETVFGVTPEEALGQYIFQYVHPDDRERVTRGLAEDWKSGQTAHDYPIRCLARDGHVLDIEVTSGLVGWPAEDAVQIFVLRDVTERRRREEERELRLRTEEALALIASRFVAAEDVAVAITETLREIGEMLKVSRAFYYAVAPGGGTATRQGEWAAEGAETLKGVDEVDLCDFEWSLGVIGVRGLLSVNSAEDLEGKHERDVARDQGTRAALFASLSVRGRFAGVIAVDDTSAGRNWSPLELEFMRDVGDTVSQALERREWVEELGRSERFRTRITESIGEGLMVVRNGLIIWVNPRACEIYDYAEEEMLGRTTEFLLPESSSLEEHVWKMIEAIPRDGIYIAEERVDRRDGSHIHVVFSVTPLGERESREGEILLTVRDITDRVRAEDETRRWASRLASLNRIAKAATSSLDLDSVTRAVLRAALDIIGADRGAILLEIPPGRGEYRLVAVKEERGPLAESLGDPSMLRRVRDLVSSAGQTMIAARDPRGGGKAGGELDFILGASGSTAALATPLVSGGKVMGALILASGEESAFEAGDIEFYDAVGAEIGVSVENALIYRELAAEHERLSLLYRSAQSMSSDFELKSLMNRAVADSAKAVGADSALLGLVEPGKDELALGAAYNIDREKLKGIRVRTDEGISGTVIQLKKAAVVQPGHDVPEEFGDDQVVKALGVTSGIALPLISGDRVMGVLGVHFLGEGRAISDADVRLLEAMGRQAGVAIENARLYEETRRHLEALERAHRELMQLDRMKSDFVSTVSHELRSPLAVIEGFARTLVEHFDRIDKDTEKESLEIILKKSISLEGLIENILDMSRIEEGRLEVNPEVLDVVELCRAVQRDQDRVAERHEVRLEADEESIRVFTDKEKTTIAIGNLVSNAVKFSPQGGTVTIAVMRAGNASEVSVSDEGVGIPPDELDRIFDRFYQVDQGETRLFPGTGLGLYITRELVGAMGGSVWAESEPGRGSTFTLSLPLVR